MASKKVVSAFLKQDWPPRFELRCTSDGEKQRFSVKDIEYYIRKTETNFFSQGENFPNSAYCIMQNNLKPNVVEKLGYRYVSVLYILVLYEKLSSVTTITVPVTRNWYGTFQVSKLGFHLLTRFVRIFYIQITVP
jgi:hypothetical protein